VRKYLQWGAAALLVLLLGAQFIRPERSNPPADPGRDITVHLAVPAEIAALLDRSCRDCHSHQTRWPWYSQVAPVSWLVADDVNRGRESVNFSEWAGYDAEAARKHLRSICTEVEEGFMPVPIYVVLHRSAALSAGQVKAVCAWTEAERDRLAGPAPAEPATTP
jgi:hypothetical protein